MAIDLKKISSVGLTLLLPTFHTQRLFEAALAIHNYILDFNKYHNKEVDSLMRDLVRKKSILETEIRNRCVTKKITAKRKRGIKISSYEKMQIHGHFSKWFSHWIESQSKRSFKTS